MNSMPADPVEQFSLVSGGPFNRALCRFGLAGGDRLPTRRATIGLALLAWLLPALLAVAQSLLDGGYRGWGYFTDWTVHARYLLAIGAMMATERYADGRLLGLVQQFRVARLLPEGERPAFAAALAAADRRSSSTLVEALLFATALIWSSITVPYAAALAGASWEGTAVAGGVVLSWAGEATRFVSNPLFLFLALRWIWWFIVWTALLYRSSRLSLRLSPLHADGAAGLGFLSTYPGVFSGFVFALSCVVASAMLKDLALEQHTSNTVWFAIAGWLAMILVLFLGPLLVFVGPLYAAREKALLEYGRLANEHNLAFHCKWIEGGRSGEDLVGSSDLSAVGGLGASIQAVQRTRVVPVDRGSVVQLVVSAGVPMLPVVATQVQLLDLAKWIIGKIL